MIIQNILLNFLFLIIPLIVLPMIFKDKYRLYVKYKQTYYILTALLVSILCMTFAVPIDSYFLFDFRFIPFLFVSLYFGPKASFILIITILSYRYYIGWPGFTLALMIHFAYFILSFTYAKRHITFSPKKKIIYLTFIQIATWAYAFVYSYIVFDAHYTLGHIFLFFSQAVAAFLAYQLQQYAESNITLHSKLVESEKLKVVSHLAASISHEIRNPLTTVRGFLQLLSQTTESIKSKEYIAISIEELDRAEAIIRTYLTFAKPTNHEITILNAKKEMYRLIDIMRPLANQYNVAIDTDLEDDLIFNGEPQSFQQVFINIMKNSIEAMSNGGTLTIIGRLVGERVLLIIKDTGIGMTKEQLSKIGEPYYTSKGEKGTGLGMMTVNSLVELMQGTINIKSTYGKGTEVVISFPLEVSCESNLEVAVTHK